MTAIVRLATQADERALFDLLMALNKENNTFGFEIDPDRVRHFIAMGTRRQGGIHGVIDYPDRPGVLAASVGIIWDQQWFSSEWGLAQLWLFVRPEWRRGTRYADALADWAKTIRDNLEKEVGHRVRMANVMISQQRLTSKLRFWRRHSGQMIGAIFEIS